MHCPVSSSTWARESRQSLQLSALHFPSCPTQPNSQTPALYFSQDLTGRLQCAGTATSGPPTSAEGNGAWWTMPRCATSSSTPLMGPCRGWTSGSASWPPPTSLSPMMAQPGRSTSRYSLFRLQCCETRFKIRLPLQAGGASGAHDDAACRAQPSISPLAGWLLSPAQGGVMSCGWLWLHRRHCQPCRAARQHLGTHQALL